MILGATTAAGNAGLVWNSAADGTTSVTINGLEGGSYYSLYATRPGDTNAYTPIVTEASINALIDKRLDERLKRGTFAERLQMKYPMPEAV